MESPEIDLISDVVQISDTFYFIQNRITNLGNSDFDSFADLIITEDDGSIIGIYNLNGFRTYYQRILKVVGDEIYLAGAIKTDSCKSSLVISTFNIKTQALKHLSSLDFCENVIEKIKIVNGLDGKTFIEEIHTKGQGFAQHIYEIDSTYALKLAIDSILFSNSFSVDFSRTGYVISSNKLFMFYDPDFNFRKQIFMNGETSELYETTKPFRQNLLLIETDTQSDPDNGVQLRLIDSTISLRKKVVILPPKEPDFVTMPYFGGLDIQSNNEVWATGYFETNSPYFDTSFYFITRVDSNLNVICQHFLGFDNKYRIFGLRAFESGGAIVFGSRVRDGLSINEGEDIFAIRVGENCELPATVSTSGPTEPLLSISAYPNPGLNDLTFSVNGFDSSALRVELIDESGHLLFSKKDLTNSIRVPELPAGQYFYRILKGERLMGIGSWVKQ